MALSRDYLFIFFTYIATVLTAEDTELTARTAKC